MTSHDDEKYLKVFAAYNHDIQIDV